MLPEVKRANVLEEAEWEDDGGGFEKEKMLQGEIRRVLASYGR